MLLFKRISGVFIFSLFLFLPAVIFFYLVFFFVVVAPLHCRRRLTEPTRGEPRIRAAEGQSAESHLLISDLVSAVNHHRH